MAHSEGFAASRWIPVAIGAAVVVVAAGVFATGSVFWGFVRPLPADAKLVSQFHRNEPAFDALAAAAIADSEAVSAFLDPILRRLHVTVRDAPRHSRLLTDAEVRSSGRERYVGLIRRAGVQGLVHSPDGTLRLRAAGNLSLHKGFVFSPRALSPVYPSLDGIERRVPSGSFSYRRLSDHWYLFLEPRE